MKYAGFWSRFGALLIDICVIVVGVLLLQNFLLEINVDAKVIATLMVLFSVVYYTFMHGSSFQDTLGKRALGLKVCGLQGERISYLHSFGRYIAWFFTAAMLCIGFLMVAFTKQKRGLHDYIAGTIVIVERKTHAFLCLIIVIATLIVSTFVTVSLGAMEFLQAFPGTKYFISSNIETKVVSEKNKGSVSYGISTKLKDHDPSVDSRVKLLSYYSPDDYNIFDKVSKNPDKLETTIGPLLLKFDGHDEKKQPVTFFVQKVGDGLEESFLFPDLFDFEVVYALSLDGYNVYQKDMFSKRFKTNAFSNPYNLSSTFYLQGEKTFKDIVGIAGYLYVPLLKSIKEFEVDIATDKGVYINIGDGDFLKLLDVNEAGVSFIGKDEMQFEIQALDINGEIVPNYGYSMNGGNYVYRYYNIENVKKLKFKFFTYYEKAKIPFIVGDKYEKNN